MANSKHFAKLKKIIDETERQAKNEELDRMMVGIPEPQRRKASSWTLDRLRFIYFQRLRGRSWNGIAHQLGVKHGASLQRGFDWYMAHMNLLPDFKQAA